MRKRKRNILFLFLGLISIAALIYSVLNFSPTYGFTIYNLQFTILPIFFALLFSFLFFLFSFILASKRRGLFVGAFIVIYLILRLNNLTHPFFLLILLVLFGSLELFFIKRK
jgi:hypothetical protein